MFELRMQAANIDEVVQIMDMIVERCIQEGDRIGYFASLYRTTTIVVRQHCDDGFFEDNERMRRLDTVFANRYFEALETHQRGAVPTQSWLVSFEAATKRRLLLLQHLLMGMNAHIMLDLGISTAQVAEGALTPSLKRDFDKLNLILTGLIEAVEEDITSVSPLFGTFAKIAARTDEAVVSYSIKTARDQAWKLATQLVNQPPDVLNALVAQQDALVARLGRAIGSTNWFINPLVWLVNWRESKDIRQIVSHLSNESWMTTIHFKVDEVWEAAQKMGINLADWQTKPTQTRTTGALPRKNS
jgi:hypothetical protein